MKQQQQLSIEGVANEALEALAHAQSIISIMRKTLIQRAGRLTRPKGSLTLTISANHWIKRRLLNLLEAIPTNA